MAVLLPLAFIVLIVAFWALAMRRFRLHWWTIIVALIVLTALFIAFFPAEDEETGDDLSLGEMSAGLLS
jgi:cell division protein FtsW (lipid II flippase)